jgi:two-component system phosphate regulon sensor histidine kinase PhoR
MNQEFFALIVGALSVLALAGRVWLPLGLAAAWILAWFFLRRMEAFLAGLRDYADRVAKGDFNAQFEPKERGGLAGTQLALESMAFDLKLAFEMDALGRKRLETALAGIQDGVLLVDKEGRLVFANPSLAHFFGAELPAGRGMFYWEFFREAEVTGGLKQVLEKGGSLIRELSLPGSAERSLLMSAASLGREGEAGGAVAFFYDRTEAKKLEKMRSDFAANVSHELRTPLTAIKAALETLQEGALEDPSVNRAFVDKAAQHAERLRELIDDLLALASVEEDKRLGRVDRKARASLGEALKETADALEAVRKKSGGKLGAELPEGLPELGISPAHLRQVLINLAENGLKYAGPSPEIRFSAFEREGILEVRVEDSGQGIPLEDLPRVFERFYRVDKARTRSSGGSGLGLAIVKHLVENYGGQVGVENLPGGGCRFWFKIPKAAA